MVISIFLGRRTSRSVETSKAVCRHSEAPFENIKVAVNGRLMRRIWMSGAQGHLLLKNRPNEAILSWIQELVTYAPNSRIIIGP